MCSTAIRPTFVKAENFDSQFSTLSFMFNRWLKMITDYGHLDERSINDDFTTISEALRDNDFPKQLKIILSKCRDYAMAGESFIDGLKYTIKKMLNALCRRMEEPAIRKIRKRMADQGMTERYAPLSRRLSLEKIRRINKEIMYADMEDAGTSRLVRRIVEKRAAQTVHHSMSSHDKSTNRYRQSVRRATSFSLYHRTFAEYDAQLRAPGTHWKVVKQKNGKRVLRSKTAYDNYEEAMEACAQYMLCNPDDIYSMTAYKCEYCGKWHIGHDRSQIKAAETVECYSELAV